MLAMAIKYSKNANQLKAVNKDNEKLITIKKLFIKKLTQIMTIETMFGKKD